MTASPQDDAIPAGSSPPVSWRPALPPLVVSLLFLAAFVYDAHLVALGALALAAFAALVWARPSAALFLLVAAFPLAPKIEFPFGNLYVATILVILFTAVHTVKRIASPDPAEPVRTPLNAPLLFFTAVLLVSTTKNFVWLLAHQEQLLRFVQFLFYLFLFFVVSDMRIAAGTRRKLVLLVLGLGVFEGFVGCYQWFTRTGVFATGTLDGEKNHFSAFLVFTGLLLFGSLLVRPRLSEKAVLLAGFLAMGVGLVFSFSRTGYVAVAVGLLLFLVIPVSRRSKIFIVLLILASAILAYRLVPSSVAERFGTIAVVAAGKTKSDISFTVRLDMWRDAFEMFRRNPVIGAGANSIPLTDNYFVKTLGETGILGLFSLVWVIVAILRAEWAALARGGGDRLIRGVRLGLLPASFALLVVYNALGDFFGVHRLMGVFWVLLALLIRREDIPEVPGEN